NYSYARASNGDGSHAFDSPYHLFKTGVSQPLWRDHLLIGLEARYISNRRATIDGSSQAPGSLRLSAHLSWSGIPKGFSASLKVYDLTGQTYEDPSPAEDSFPITKVTHSAPTVVFRVSYQR